MNHRILTTALAFSLSASFAFAQQSTPAAQSQAAPQAQPSQQDPGALHHRDHQPRDPHAIAEHISEKLNLTADQAAKLEPIIADRQQKIAALRANTSLTPDQRHEQIRAIHKSSRQQFASILTPAQLQQLKSMHHDHQHGHHNGANPNPNPAS